MASLGGGNIASAARRCAAPARPGRPRARCLGAGTPALLRCRCGPVTVPPHRCRVHGRGRPSAATTRTPRASDGGWSDPARSLAQPPSAVATDDAAPPAPRQLRRRVRRSGVAAQRTDARARLEGLYRRLDHGAGLGPGALSPPSASAFSPSSVHAAAGMQRTSPRDDGELLWRLLRPPRRSGRARSGGTSQDAPVLSNSSSGSVELVLPAARRRRGTWWGRRQRR